MDKKNYKILQGLLVFLGVLVLLLYFYFSPFSNFLKKAPKGLENIKKEVLLPGLFTSDKEKEIEKSLSDKEIIQITNEYRQKEKRQALVENELLNRAAMNKVNDMFEKQYFEHVSPEGRDVSDLLNDVQYFYVVAGENLALGYFSDSRDLVDGWMGSPGHRENILNPSFKEIGVAHKMGMFKGKKQYLAVQIFATSTRDCPLPSKELKSQIETKEKEIKDLEAKIQSLEAEINSLKAQIDALYKEVESLFAEGKLLISQGNSLINKGNQVYAQTKDRDAAEEYWSQGKILQAQGQEKINEANLKNKTLQSLQNELREKINQHNLLVSEMNSSYISLQGLILEYNKQVDAFNKCL